MSASNGFMNGEPLIVCALTMWSSSNNWISSTADRIDTPCWIQYNTWFSQPSEYVLQIVEIIQKIEIGMERWNDRGRGVTKTCKVLFVIVSIFINCSMPTYWVSVRCEFKVHVLPFNLHLLHGFLQTKLFTGSTTYLIKSTRKQMKIKSNKFQMF